jgi:hypothetical protein
VTNNNPTKPEPVPPIDIDAEALARPDTGDLTPPHGDICHLGDDVARATPPKGV